MLALFDTPLKIYFTLYYNTDSLLCIRMLGSINRRTPRCIIFNSSGLRVDRIIDISQWRSKINSVQFKRSDSNISQGLSVFGNFD